MIPELFIELLVKIIPLKGAHKLCFPLFPPFSHGLGRVRGHASCTAHLDELQGPNEWEDAADAVERHVWHRSKMETVTGI